MDHELKQSILETVAYFDVYNYPLTASELYSKLWKYPRKLSYANFLQSLDDADALFPVVSKHGYYFLSGREQGILERHRALPVVKKKMKLAVRAVKQIRLMPFVEAVFICNTLAAEVAHEDSDIDVLIITTPKRIWLARLYIIVLLTLLRKRISESTRADRVCLSFYVSSDALDFSSIQLSDDVDIYLAFWIQHLIPLYDPQELHKNISEKNVWVNDLLSEYRVSYVPKSVWQVRARKWKGILAHVFEYGTKGKLGNILEAWAKQVQQKKIEQNFGTLLQTETTHVVVRDNMLKFHANDRRAAYREEWRKRVAAHEVSK